MKKLALIILTIISISAYSQDTTIVNFCYSDSVIGVTYCNPDTVAFYSDIELLPEYGTLKIVICDAYGVEFENVESFIYQNTSQTGWLQKERFGLKIIGESNYRWKLLSTDNFTPSQLYAINDFGIKLKNLLK